MNFATLLRYVDMNQDNPWKIRYYLADHYSILAEKYKIGLCAVTSEYDLEKTLDTCDGLLLPGSATNIDPKYYNGKPLDVLPPVDEYALDAKVVDYFVKAGKPILGICGGLQELNIFFGGSIKRIDDVNTHHNGDARGHIVDIKEGSFVHDVFGDTSAYINSYHSWEIDRLAPCFDVVARTRDGVIEAIECKEKKIFATQWHPELLLAQDESVEHKFFENFIKCCER